MALWRSAPYLHTGLIWVDPFRVVLPCLAPPPRWVLRTNGYRASTLSGSTSLSGQKADASERHYLNNPALSDNGAQCGVCEPPQEKRVGDTQPREQRCGCVSPTRIVYASSFPHTAPEAPPSGCVLRLSVGLLRFNHFEVACRPSLPPLTLKPFNPQTLLLNTDCSDRTDKHPSNPFEPFKPFSSFSTFSLFSRAYLKNLLYLHIIADYRPNSNTLNLS